MELKSLQLISSTYFCLLRLLLDYVLVPVVTYT